MKYNKLTIESNKDRKRVGRGISAGQGKTAGRGTKGQNSRTGKKLRPMFQGGQRPLAQAVPKKRGFTSKRAKTQVVYIDTLNELAGKVIDNALLFENGFIASPFHSTKVINRGELTAKLDLRVQLASKSVIESIKKQGGTFTATDTPLQKSQSTEVENS